MKTNKILSMAFAVAALASCSSDDLQVADKTVQLASDGSQVFVTVEEPGSASTRAAFATTYTPDGKIGRMFLWTPEDNFKMYCTDSWKPQTYKFTKYAQLSGVNGKKGAVFTWADAESKYNKGTDAEDLTGREYAVYPAGNMKFTDENRTALHLTIPADTSSFYALPETLGEQEGLETYKDWKVSKALVPLFGFAKDDQVSFNYMTAVLRVNLQGLEAGSYTLTLSSTSNQLSGEFVSTDFDAAKVDIEKSTLAELNENLPVFNTTTESVDDDDKAISFKFTTTETQGDYLFFLPVPTGDYAAAALKLELKEGENEPKELAIIRNSDKAKLADEAVTLERGELLYAEDAKGFDFDGDYVPGENTTLDGTDLNGLQTLVAEYANYGRPVELNLTGSVKVYGNSYDPNLSTFSVPELKNNITLNITTIESAGSSTDATLKIENLAASQYTITINYVNASNDATVPVEINSKNDILLGSGDKGWGKVTATTTDNADITLAGSYTAEVNVNAAGTATLPGTYAEAVNVEAASAVLSGAYTKAVTAEATGDVTLSGTSYGDAITATGATVNVEKTTIDKKATLTATEGIVVAEDATITGSTPLTINGDITINGKVTTSNTDVYTGDITVNGTIRNAFINEGKTLTVNKGATIVNSVNTNGGKVNLKDIKFNVLRIKAPVAGDDAIVLENVETKIEATASSDDKTVVLTKGSSNITAVSGSYAEKIIFKSEWTETTEAVDIPSDNKIYTAAQLAKLQEITTAADYTLATDVTITDAEATWTPSKVYAGGSNNTFEGGNHTIDGLKVVGTANGIGVFTALKGVKISNLNLNNVSVTGPANAVQKIGALAGEITGDAEIDNVAISGSSIETSGKGTNFFRVGGLVGHIGAGEVSIKNSAVNFNAIKGSHFVGGLIGSIGSTASVTITEDKGLTLVAVDNITCQKQVKKYEATFGMLVGAMTSADATLKFTKSDDGKYYAANVIAGHRSDFFYNVVSYTQDGATFKFLGVDDNYVGYSSPYNHAGNSAKRQTKTNVYKAGSDTEQYTWAELNKYIVDSSWAD